MQNNLTNEELTGLQEQRNFLKESLKKRLPFQFIIIILAIITGIFIEYPPLIFAGIIAVLVSLYINYQISFKWIQELNIDIKSGYKSVELLKIKEIKKGRINNEVYMSNGLKINEAEFESFEISESDIKTGNHFIIEFSPKNRYIFNIERTKKNDS
ncbi:MAG: hypothetical protein ACNS60_20745 [Candidatus Cyclobacteriaceae bacterium M2_1C_046]